MPAVRTKTVSWSVEQVNIPGVAFRDYETETAFQIYCADWLRKQYELTGLDGFSHWHHSANERSGAMAGFRAKMMGQAKGWPDFVRPGPLPGLSCAIELKVDGGALSREQKAWLEYFRRIGWRVEVIYKFERFRDLVLSLVAD